MSEKSLKKISLAELNEMLDVHARERTTLTIHIGSDWNCRLDLRGYDLSGYDLSNRYLGLIDFCGSSLKNCNFHKSFFEISDLQGCDLRHSNLSDCNLSDSDFSRCDLSHSDLSNSNATRSDFRNSDMSNCILRNTDMSWCNLSGIDFRGSDLQGANTNYSTMKNSKF